MKDRPHLVPAIIASGLLFGALASLPYGYYQMLRWVVGGISIYIAYKAYTWDKKWATWLFAGCAILFNPIVPIHLSREIWQPIDIVFGFVFIVSIAVLRQPIEVASVSSDKTETRQTLEDKQAKPSPNFCPNCGYKFSESNNYCSKCGNKITE